MRRAITCVLIGVTTVIVHSMSLYATELSLGLKSGISYSRLSSYKGGIGISGDGYPEYAYPPGFTVGLLGEMKIADKTSVRAELAFLKLTSKMTIRLGHESKMEQEFRGSYVRIPFLLQRQIDRRFLPYFLVGVDIGYLIEAEYKFRDLFYGDTGVFEITEQLPPVDISAAIGMGQKFKVSDMSFLWELRLMLGLTKYEFIDPEASFGTYIGTWRNNIIQFGIGVFFK